MPDYKKMYFFLSGQVAGAIDSLQAVVDALKKAQLATEEMYLASEGDEPASDKPNTDQGAVSSDKNASAASQ